MDFLDRWPNWLRWVLLIPGTLLVASVGTAIITFVYRWMFDYSYEFARASGYIISSLALVYVAPQIAPKGKLPVAFIFGCTWGIVHLTNVVLQSILLFNGYEGFIWWELAASIVSDIVIISFLVSKTKEHFKEKYETERNYIQNV